MTLNLRDLEYVVAVSELSSFSKAADKCAVSQPTLSTQLKKLEERLGVVLFERSNKRVQLTDTGSQIVTIARRIINDSSEIDEVARSAKNPLGGMIRLGAIPTLASYLYPQLVKSIRAELPEAKVVLSEEKTEPLIERLTNGEIDFAIAAMPINETCLESQELFYDPFYLAVPTRHLLAKRKFVDLTSLKDFKLLLLEDGHCLGDQALAICSATGINVDNEVRATSLETLRQMVIAETGITLVPKIACDKSHQGIVYLPFEGDGPGRKIALYWRKTMRRAAIQKSLCSLIAELGIR